MKKRTFKLLSLIVALIAAVTLTVGYVFAWFFDKKNANFTINGHSAGAYFDSGDGSEEKPFVIANATHMHNLAVLQNTGRFATNGVQKQYYFEIKKTIEVLDMSKIYIPPIGNDEFPFIGIFNGNGKSVTDLKVTTNKSLLGDDYPTQSSDDYQFSRAVGLFGMTGSQSDISNVILDNPLVDVANTNTRYFSTDAGAVKAAPQVAGIAVGFVAGKCSSIGVRAVDEGATLDMKVNGYSTFNSILGALGDNVSSAVTGGGHKNGTGGTGANFGASFDIPQMADRLVAIGKNKKSGSPSWLLPDMDYQSDIPVPVAGEKVPFSVSGFTDENSYVVGPNAVEQTSNLNIGYFLGNQNKFDNKNITAVAKMTLNGDVWEMSGTGNYIAPLGLYEFKDSNGSYSTGNMQATYNKANFNPLSAEAFEALPQNVKDFLPKDVGETKNYDAIILRQTFTNNPPIFSWDKSHWSYHGQVSYMGKTYGEGFRKVFGELDYAVDENGYRYTSDGNKLDENGFVFIETAGGEKNYLPENSSFALPIYEIDDNGYGKNADGYYYYSGALQGTIYEDSYIDDSGYVYSPTKGYFINLNDWRMGDGPFTIDDDGYVLKSGERLKDAHEKDVLAYGYQLETVVNNGSNETWMKNNNGYLEIDRGGWYSHPVPIEGNNNRIKAKTGQGVRYQDYKNGIFLPNSAIWFKPSVEGKLRFIMWTPSDKCGFTLGKITRTSGTADNPFQVNFDETGGINSASSFKTEELIKVQNLPVKVFVYYEIDVTEDVRAGNVEYMLMEYGTNGARFLYLDMGASAAEDTSGIDREKSVSAVDFIYDGVEIKQGNPADDAADALIKVGDFIVKTSGEEVELYEASKTSVYFENLSTVFKLVFLRLHNEEGKHSGKTICLEQSNPVPDTDSDIKATFATYVCPTIGGGSGTVSGGGGGGTVTPNPGPNPDVETVNDYINISTDTNESGHSISFTSESGYFSVQGVGNYKYSTVLGGALIGTSTGRGLKITAGDNLESIKFTIKLGISDDSKYNASSKSSTAAVTGAKTATLESESGNTVYEYEVTLNAGETITITGARYLALVEITAVVTPQT